jgi:septum formation protein
LSGKKAHGARLILASHSPRRRELLAAAGFEFESIAANVPERFDLDLTLRELAWWNARRKALAVARQLPHCVVLAADTLVALDGKVIGKPRDLENARQILAQLSGRIHEVCSAVCIVRLAPARSTSFCEISRVRFRRLNEREIDNYFGKINPLDKAGAYAAQGHGAEIIEKVYGSFTNVVGLPMETTIPALKQFGIEPRKN